MINRLCLNCGAMLAEGEACSCGREPAVLRRRVYDDPRWRSYTRPIVIERDRVCVECGEENDTSVHHRVPLVELIALDADPFDPVWCILLCSRCHGAVDGIGRVAVG